tara:strand:+ start:1263 stop:2315 length:1053 start_codon:yes stop_codon:yes gene_type:complete
MEKNQESGLTGLVNLGNTCFINSCLSVLSHTYELNNLLDKNKQYKSLLSKKQSPELDNSNMLLLTAWDDLRKIMWKTNCIVKPVKFVNTIQAVIKHQKLDGFEAFGQNDISEFFTFLINGFHSALSRKTIMTINGTVDNDTDKLAVQCLGKIKEIYSNDYSEILAIFSAMQATRLVSMENTVMSVIPEPFFTIHLSIPENIPKPTLLDCFDLYVEDELLENENAWFNENTNTKESVKRGVVFWSLPTIMTIDIKRVNAMNQKIKTLVSYPLDNLNLSKFVKGYASDSSVYELFGICNHSGTPEHGHYYAFVKSCNSKWYLFNDHAVSEVRNPSELITENAYFLIYRKKYG